MCVVQPQAPAAAAVAAVAAVAAAAAAAERGEGTSSGGAAYVRRGQKAKRRPSGPGPHSLL